MRSNGYKSFTRKLQSFVKSSNPDGKEGNKVIWIGWYVLTDYAVVYAYGQNVILWKGYERFHPD